MIEKTVFFGLKSVDRWDILYPIHTAGEKAIARKEGSHTSMFDCGALRVVLYSQRPLPEGLKQDYLAIAADIALGNVPGGEQPRYSEKGAQQ